MANYQMNIKKDIEIKTVEDIIDLYDYFEDIYKNSKYNNDGSKGVISANIKKGSLWLENLSKKEFIEETLGLDNVDLDKMRLTIYFSESDEESIVISINKKSEKIFIVSVSSNNKSKINDFCKLIENHEKVISNKNERLLIVEGDSQINLSIEEQNIFYKYGFPIATAAIAPIIADIILALMGL